MEKRYKRCDLINVVDLETTCWEDDDPSLVEYFKTHEKDFSQNETIEFGVSVFDVSQNKSIENLGILVKPVRTTVSDFCTRLTGHTLEELNKFGVPYEEACQTLVEKYDSKNIVFASWGDFDREQTEREDLHSGVKNYPFGKRHLNIKTMFALKHRLVKEVSVEQALNLIGLDFQGRQHNGADDAYNISLLLADVLK